MIQFDNAVERFGGIILNELKEENIKCWIAGGSLRDYFMSKPITTDYDIFFPNENEYDKAYSYITSKDHKIKWESDNGCKIEYDGKTFDLIKKYFPSPQATIDAFDFTTSMLAIDHKDVYHGKTTFIDLAKRQLMINKITYPASTLSRAFRYTKKGFHLCLGEMKKIIEAIQEMPKKEDEQKNEKENLEEDLSSFDPMFAGID